MSIISKFKENISNKKEKLNEEQKIATQLVMLTGNSWHKYNTKSINSDIVRSCIKPFSTAVGKLKAKHILENEKEIIEFPSDNLKMLLKEPNPLMTMQDFQEKLANQLALNNDAFAVILRNVDGTVDSIYPLDVIGADVIYREDELYLKFSLQNGKMMEIKYQDVIHIRTDFYNNDIFGLNKNEALKQLLEVNSATDISVVKAIKNSSIFRWILKFSSSLRPEDIEKQVRYFEETYMSMNSVNNITLPIDNKMDLIPIEPKDYVPNATISDRNIKRIYNFFNTNEKIVNGTANENEYNFYYEMQVEPIAMKLSNEFTRKLLNEKERLNGHKIVFDTSEILCSSRETILKMVDLVDRGALTANEWRKMLNFGKIEGGDKAIRRLDTAEIGGEKD